MVGTKRTEAFEGAINLVPEIISRDADSSMGWRHREVRMALIAERTRDGVAAAARKVGTPADQSSIRRSCAPLSH